MKLEPVAWQFRHKPTNASWNYCSKTDAAEFAAIGDYETRPLYAIPEGYKVVPVEPTEAMLRAGREVFGEHVEDTDSDYLRIYRAMIEGEQ